MLRSSGQLFPLLLHAVVSPIAYHILQTLQVTALPEPPER